MNNEQPLIDLKIQYMMLKKEIDQALQAVLSRCDFILGKEVGEFESSVSKYLNVNHAAAVASGTDALKIALHAAGVGKNDEVITTPFTFIATVEAVASLGARPVFADIDGSNFNIDPEEIKKEISSRTKAIIPVHLYGQPAEMDEIIAAAEEKNILVIEDCAQAFGAEYKGKKAGSLGKAGCFSFFPGKNLGCYGDGGLVVTDDEQMAAKIKLLRNHGSKSKYEHIMPGYNSRLDTLQAAVLLIKLRYLDSWNKQRRACADIYRKNLAPLGFSFQKENEYSLSSMNYFTFIVERDRDKLQKHLEDNGIATGIYYPSSLHLQKVYAYLGYAQGDFPAAEMCQNKILSLPMYPELTEKQITRIVKVIASYYN
ncbi:MAG: DegT/DnrJ/EryC1/StrS family aminotransferase [bacterium]